MWFSYIYNFIIILSRVYNEPIQRPAHSWLVSLIRRALHRYRRGQGSNPLQAWIFFRLSFRNCKSCVYNCDDLPSYNTKLSRITSFQRIHSKKTKEDGALFRNFCPLDRVSLQMRYEADFLFDNGDYIRSRVIMC